jgi:site-specific DNA recombinase
MVYSHSSKHDRTYFYYVCLNAQRKGWAVCPAKSLSARDIEGSVLNRLREIQPALFAAAEWEQMDRIRQVQVIGGLVERVAYDGAARQISIRLRAPGEKVPA